MHIRQEAQELQVKEMLVELARKVMFLDLVQVEAVAVQAHLVVMHLLLQDQ
jgi:hypothetical protein